MSERALLHQGAIPTAFKPGYVNCGCCNGLEWGGEYPRECRNCGGSGRVYRYASGRLALWYGGPFCGQEHPNFARKVVDDA